MGIDVTYKHGERKSTTFRCDFYELDEIETVMPAVKKVIVRKVYQAQLKEALDKTHAVTWTADITGFSERWVWECVCW